jgi:hypothetical protein
MKDITTKMVLDTWQTAVNRADSLIQKLTDADMLNAVATNRNRGIYLLGHLTAVHDMMLPLLGMGDRLHPEIKSSFIRTPDDTSSQPFTVSVLRKCWTDVNSKLETQINALSSDEWFKKHSSISEEEFEKEPHRNKLNVIINRTNHLSYHTGQMALLKK